MFFFWTDSTAAYLDAIKAAGLAHRVVVETLPRREKPSADQMARTEALMAYAVPAGLLPAMPKLRWVQSMTAGVEAWLALPDLPASLTLTCARGAHREAMPENIIGALFHVANLRRAVVARFPRPGRRVRRTYAQADVWERVRGVPRRRPAVDTANDPMAAGMIGSGGTVHKLPADFRKAIESSAAVKGAWADITPLARNEWICWVTSAKKRPENAASRSASTSCAEACAGRVAGPDARTAELVQLPPAEALVLGGDADPVLLAAQRARQRRARELRRGCSAATGARR